MISPLIIFDGHSLTISGTSEDGSTYRDNFCSIKGNGKPYLKRTTMKSSPHRLLANYRVSKGEAESDLEGK